MTVRDWVKRSAALLDASSVGTAQLDAEVLLSDALEVDRSWLHAHADEELQGSVVEKLQRMVERRAGHEPLAYIRGKQEFYGRDFYVSPDTLTPRPETETMIALLLEQLKEKGNELILVDVGTGSGCIIITAALEIASLGSGLRSVNYKALDISKPALEIARKNAQKHQVNVDFHSFDLKKDHLHEIHDAQSVIYLCNLPYVPTDFNINLAASHEPAFAIYGGGDGLDYYRLLFEQIGASPAHIDVFTESLPPQHEELAVIAEKHGFTHVKSEDFIQHFQHAR